MAIERDDDQRIDATGNAAALETTIAALTGLTDEHAAVVQQARTLARQLDYGEADSKDHGEYRQVLKILLEAGKPQTVDLFAEALKALAENASGVSVPMTTPVLLTN